MLTKGRQGTTIHDMLYKYSLATDENDVWQ